MSVPRLSEGPATGWPVYCDFGACDWAAELIAAAHHHLWGLTANAGLDVRITTILPDLYPTDYTLALFRPQKVLGWRPNVPAHANWGAFRNDALTRWAGVEVAIGTYTQEPKWVGAITAHELGHVFTGWGHEPTPLGNVGKENNIMGEPLPLVGQWSPKYRDKINATIRDLKAGLRQGIVINPVTGQYTTERFNVKTGKIA